MLDSDGLQNVSITVFLGVLTAGSAVLSFQTLPLKPIASSYVNAQAVFLMLLLGTVVSFPRRADSPSAKLVGIYLIVATTLAVGGLELVQTSGGPPVESYILPFILAAIGSAILDTGLLAWIAGFLSISLYAFVFLYTILTIVVGTDIVIITLLILATPLVFAVVQTLEMEATS